MVTSLHCNVQGAIDKLLLLIEQLIIGIVLSAAPISIIHLIPGSDFSQSHLERYMKLVADALIFLRIVLLRNNIKIQTVSRPTTHLYLNMDGHYQIIPMADTCGMISYLCFLTLMHFLLQFISQKKQIRKLHLF